MNLYRLLLFVTLAVHVSGTPTQPSASGGAGVGSNSGLTNRPHRPDDASTSNISPAVPAPARLEPFDDITWQLERGPNPDPTSDSPLSDYDQTASLTQRRRPLPRLTAAAYAKLHHKALSCGRYILNNKMKCALYFSGVGCLAFIWAGMGEIIANSKGTYCPAGSELFWVNESSVQEMCKNETTGKIFPGVVHNMKRGLEGSAEKEGKEGKERMCSKVEWTGESCPCETATITVGADGKITGVTDVKDVKHTKREVLKAVFWKRTSTI